MLLEIIFIAVACLALLVSGVILHKVSKLKKLLRYVRSSIDFNEECLEEAEESISYLEDYLNIKRDYKDVEPEFTYIKK